MQKVLFDPGYSSCVNGVMDSIEFVYETFVSSEMSLKQKKFQFSILFAKFKKMITENVSFYLGCLLWAVYLKSIEDGVIENNPCLNSVYDEKNAVEETNFIINFIEEKLNKDAKYYINKTYTKDDRYIKVLKAYNEFISINEGFIKLEKTIDIKLPDSLKKVDIEGVKKIKEKIDEAIFEKNLLKLFDVYELILE